MNSIPIAETPFDAARREFQEELGHQAPVGDLIELGEVSQKGGKRVIAFAVEGDLDGSHHHVEHVCVEWPPKSGRMVEFPEMDRAAWFTIDRARWVVNPAQVEFLDRLVTRLDDR